MSAAIPAGPGTATGGLTAATLPEAFAATARAVPERLALRTADGARTLTWAQYDAAVSRCASALAQLGVRPGDRVALLLGNRPEFHVVDAAVTRLGGVAFSVYSTYSHPQIQGLLQDSGARLLVTEGAFAGVAAELVLTDPVGPGVVSVDRDVRDAIALDDLVAAATPREDWPTAQPGDLVTLIYTSGTTGPPKGVELTHANVMAAARSFAQVIEFAEETDVVSYLPMAHVAERNASHYLPMALGFTTTCCPSPADVYDVVAAVHPSWLFGVPRIWEKLQARVETALDGAAGGAACRAAIDRGMAAVRADAEAGRTLRAPERSSEDAERLAAVRREHGLDRLRAAHTGAAPLPAHVLGFFHALGVPLGELWGLSETTGAGTASPAGAVRYGTVGRPAPGMDLRLDDDGEVLLRGPMVMRGYRGRPEETAAVLDGDRWFHTGDLGALDGEGYLSIVGRKKEIIISSSGKNMSPSLIEAELKSASALIAHACVIGDGRPYNTALLAIDPEVLAAAFGPAATPGDEVVRAALEAAVAQANERLARVEQVKRFHVTPAAWSPQDGQLTPTMKLRRGPIAERYAREIDELYARPR